MQDKMHVTPHLTSQMVVITVLNACSLTLYMANIVENMDDGSFEKYAGPDLSAYGVDPVFKSGTDLYNADLDDETDTVSFYNCSTLGYNATYNIPNTDTTVIVSAAAFAVAPL